MYTHSRTKLIRLDDAKELTGMARSTLYRKMKNGTFPRPLKLSARHVAWREQDILDWLDALVESQGLMRSQSESESKSSSKRADKDGQK